MTENQVLIKTPEEAIETIKSNMPTSGYQMLRESLDMAITALKEVQQYREIGTVEQVKNQKENLKIAYKIINEYESCGTIEECREARKKQIPKKTKELDIEYGYFICGNCGGAIAYTDDFTSHKYCLNCGQAILWENLEGMEDE